MGPEQWAFLRRLALVMSTMAVYFILFPWRYQGMKLEAYRDQGEVLYGTVAEKGFRLEPVQKGGAAKIWEVWVRFIFDERPQKVLVSEHVTADQWATLSVGDTVGLNYQPHLMYVEPDGEVWFRDGPVLKSSLDPALGRLIWYPVIAAVVLLLGLLPSCWFRWRKRKG